MGGKQLWDTRAAVTATVFERGENHIFVNNRFAETFMTAGEMYYKMGQYNCIPILLWAR